MAFDAFSYARRLKQAGMSEGWAEFVAEATRDAIAVDMATNAAIADVRHEIAMLRIEMKNAMVALETRMIAAIELLELRLTIRLGGFIAVGVAVLPAIIKL